MTAYARLREALLADGKAIKDNGFGRIRSQCPAHASSTPDSKPLAVTAIEGSVLLHCHAGCDNAAILGALGLTMADLFDNRRDTTYVYPGGREVHRKPNKNFPQSGNKADRSLFRADRIPAADHIYVAEGEKDCLAAEAVGAVAVCSAQGAGKAHFADWTPLRDKAVTVVVDNDEPGRKHAAQVVEQLRAAGAASIRLVHAATGKDLADHIAAGHTLEELVVEELPAAATRSSEDFVDLPRIWRASDLRPATPPRWLAKGRLPLAAISLLVGDEGIGKSLLWVLIAAAVTTGKPLPSFGIPARTPCRVLLIITEDEWSTTVLPRLIVAGADISMIDVICTEDDGSGAPVFPRDMHLVREADPVPALIVVDAWLDTVSAALSVRDPQQARQALHPWKEVATLTDASVLLICHTNRTASTNPRDRYGATGELRKKARMTLYAQADDDGLLVVGPEKMNTAAPIPASTFAITGVQHFDPTDDHDGTVPTLVYQGESTLTAREHLAATAEAGGEEPGGNPAKTFIHEYLKDNGGEAEAADVLKEGRKAGFSEQELKDARRRHRKPRIESRKANYGGGWVWAIAADEGGTADQGGSGTPQGGEDGSQEGMSESVPPTPPSTELPPSQPVPPGGVTADTPGQTDRVAQALANAEKAAAAAETCPECGLATTPGMSVDGMHGDCASRVSQRAPTAQPVLA